MAATQQGRSYGASDPLYSDRISTMGWVTDSYLNGGQRPDRYQKPEGRWVELQARLNRWGRSSTWRRLEQLGQIAKTD
ncbi:hypothetical protein [Synechococcus sp. MIT S9508]|uniref:hypothetical protein n=1 Tax=Synechococcus sp. MIT S9508 TaxID=1801629 RepID=UPI000830148B|nr:hypothetical protein [Synechococcus sp. MIT S9508]